MVEVRDDSTGEPVREGCVRLVREDGDRECTLPVNGEGFVRAADLPTLCERCRPVVRDLVASSPL